MGRPAKRKIITFANPRQVEIHSSSLPATDADSVLVKTTHTSISRGTELNLYHGRTRSIRGIWYAWYPDTRRSGAFWKPAPMLRT